MSSASTMRHRERAPLRRLLLVSILAMIPVLAGCEAGNDAPSLGFHHPTDAADAVYGDLAVRNVFIVGAPLGASLQPGQSASLFFSIINNGSTPDTLLSITARGSATSVQLPAASIPVNPEQPVLLNGPQTKAFLADITRTISSGSTLELTLNFKNEGQVSLQVPVMAKAAHYVTYSPPPSPTAPASPSTTAARKKHHKVAVSPSPTPSVSPTAPVSPTPSPSAS